jgi:hypothetical protein
LSSNTVNGSGWEAAANILKDDGYKVSVVQHPETSYAEGQKYTKAAIDAMDGPVVLVGHSYGGVRHHNHPKVGALCLHCRIRAGHWGKLRHNRASLTASLQGVQAGQQRHW